MGASVLTVAVVCSFVPLAGTGRGGATAAQVASEAVENIRTVVALGQEPAFLSRYRDELAVPDRASARNAHIGGLSFGFGEMMSFLIWALAFYYGALLVSWGVTDFAYMMRAVSAIIFSAMLGACVRCAPAPWPPRRSGGSHPYLLPTHVGAADAS